MPPDLRTYLKLVRAGFARQANYRLAMLAGLATNLVFGFVRAAILFAAVRSAGGTLAGYTAGTISSYVWLSQGLIGAIELSGSAEIGDRVRTGDVAIDFTRPVDLQTWHLAEDMGRAAYTLIPRGLPSVLVGALTVGLVLPRTPLPYLLGVLSIVLGVAISFYARYAVNILGFWLLDTRGVRTVYLVTCTFLAGLYVPVSLFPTWLHTLAYLTPFPSILQTPINVISGRDLGVDAVADISMQVIWVAVVCMVGRVLTSAGRRKLVVQGG
ncbi:MAG: viologen exporter family transport system permease protein [Nocardioidaceae bacterium]|nr:viologen exporter family transport system permease protein [Nocardioidaceae bacterium]MDX6309593.1 viologen exporter family transport system permease protein [Nocardioidaceae bacterium]